MRTLLVGALAATLVGCSCLLPPQTGTQACMDLNGSVCFDRAVASQPIEPEPESFKANSTTKRTKAAIAAKPEKTWSDNERGKPGRATDKARSTIAAAKIEPPTSGQAAEPPADPVTPIPKTVIAAKTENPSFDDESAKPGRAPEKARSTIAAAKIEPPASGQTAGPSDPVLAKAKTTIAAKLEVPASAEFGEMKRAFRKNLLGQSVDTICGHVRGKKASGEDTGDRPFLYLVKEDDAYVVDGPPGSAGATAYRNICN